jgi:hypothetical protein
MNIFGREDHRYQWDGPQGLVGRTIYVIGKYTGTDHTSYREDHRLVIYLAGRTIKVGGTDRIYHGKTTDC